MHYRSQCLDLHRAKGKRSRCNIVPKIRRLQTCGASFRDVQHLLEVSTKWTFGKESFEGTSWKCAFKVSRSPYAKP